MCTQKDAIRILHKTKRMCSEIFPIKEAYLYGSYARGDFHSESDVDILITADIRPEDISKYRGQIAAITSELSLENDVTVSVTVKPEEQFRRFSEAMPFYRNVKAEGIRYA